jgi:hypothetical protein
MSSLRRKSPKSSPRCAHGTAALSDAFQKQETRSKKFPLGHVRQRSCASSNILSGAVMAPAPQR